MKEAREFIMKCVFILTACVSIAAVVLICIFMFANGIPAIAKIGPLNFLLGEKWKPMNNIFGILPMIVGSIYVTAGAIIIGVPIAFFASVYLAKFCNEKLYKILKPAVELMAGIPSIVYGFFGLVVIVPIMQKLMGGSGKSVLTASILLGIMILPTVIGVAESSIRRAIGETMAVIMVAGNQPVIPRNLAMGVRTLTSNIVMEMGYATDLHREALIATAVVLFVLILIINLCCSALQRRSGQ